MPREAPVTSTDRRPGDTGRTLRVRELLHLCGQGLAPGAGALPLTLRQRALRVLDEEALAGEDLVAAPVQTPRDPAGRGAGQQCRAVDARVERGRGPVVDVLEVAQPLA